MVLCYNIIMQFDFFNSKYILEICLCCYFIFHCILNHSLVWFTSSWFIYAFVYQYTLVLHFKSQIMQHWIALYLPLCVHVSALLSYVELLDPRVFKNFTWFSQVAFESVPISTPICVGSTYFSTVSHLWY